MIWQSENPYCWRGQKSWRRRLSKVEHHQTKNKRRNSNKAYKDKKRCWSTSLPDFTYVLCTLMTAIRWTSEPSHQFLWRQVTGWCGRQQHRNAHCPLKFDTNGIENDFPWWIYFEWSCPIIEVLIMKSLICAGGAIQLRTGAILLPI